MLALCYAELGATYPVAGGSARFPYYSYGPSVGFTAGWAAWLLASLAATLSAYTYRIRVEDEMLVAALSEPYAQYQREVGALILSLHTTAWGSSHTKT